MVKLEFNPVNHDFQEQLPAMLASPLYKFLLDMPKGALHHLHVTAGPSAETYVELTYDPAVYFNEREMMFKVAPNGLQEDGYIRCVDMRNFSKDKNS